MGTLLYFTLKVLGKINVEDDWVNICFLLAIDSIAIAIVFHALIGRRSKSTDAKTRDGN